MDDYRILGIDKEEETKMMSWIDASYAVHEDMKSHTGGTTSLGLGTLSNKSSAQRLNVKSACEAELVAMSDYIPYNIWLKISWKNKDTKLKKISYIRTIRVQFF